MDLKSKLQMYKSNQQNKVCQTVRNGRDIHDVFLGTIICNQYGSFYLAERRYSHDYMYGDTSLGQIRSMDCSGLSMLCGDFSKDNNINQLLFLDTETTGLSCGAGTIAFLIGVGYFDDDGFVTRQYFMRDYNEELPMLQALNELFSRFKGLVTFNGKSYDMNLIQSRFTFNRLKLCLRDPVHIDLLHPSRRIWKYKLENCRLSSLEEHILGAGREDDISGALIPSVYFKYLEERDASDILKVIEHNRLDILAMVTLLAKINKMLIEPVGGTWGLEEMLGLGTIFESNGKLEPVAECYRACIDSGNSYVKETAGKRLAEIYKRNRNYDKAVEQWQHMLADTRAVRLYPMIELAKYYEHKEKNMERALEIVEEALALCIKAGIKYNIYYNDLKKRLNRLKRKSNITSGNSMYEP